MHMLYSLMGPGIVPNCAYYTPAGVCPGIQSWKKSLASLGQPTPVTITHVHHAYYLQSSVGSRHDYNFHGDLLIFL